MLCAIWDHGVKVTILVTESNTFPLGFFTYDTKSRKASQTKS